jgi:hypothetical protein
MGLARRRATGTVGAAGGKGTRICARLMSPRASATTWLIRRQLPRTPQCDSSSHALCSPEHSVTPSGPSIASTISIRRIASGGRASR